MTLPLPGVSRRTLVCAVLFAFTLPIVQTFAQGEYILLSTYSGPPGSSVSVQGFGFLAGSAVHVTFQGLAKDVTASAGGTFTTSPFIVPVSPGASYPIVATVGSVTTQASFYVQGLFPSASPTDWWVTPGQTFGIIADHFLASEQVRVFAGTDTTPTATLTADTSGSIRSSGTVTAGGAFAGSTMTVRLVGVQSNASASFAVTVGGFFVHAAPSSYYVTPGQSITVTGGGFAPGENIRILNDTVVATTTVANAQGNFTSSAITIAFVQPGQRTFHVIGDQSNTSADFTIQIGGLFPSAAPSDFFALPGQTIGVIASGFLAGESVQLQTSLGAVVATAVADSTGSVPGWSHILPVPFGSSGNLTYRVAGQTSHTSATFGFSVGGFDPQLDPSLWYLAPRQLLGGTGRGFSPGETVNISVNGVIVTHVTADAHGNFTTSVRAPATGASFTFSARGAQSGGSATRTIGLNTACIVSDTGSSL